MSCTNNNIDWFDFLAGRLDDKSIVQVENHLKECEVCRKDLAITKAALTEIDIQKNIEPDNDLADKVLNYLSIQSGRKVIVMNSFNYIQRIAAILIIGVGILVGILLGTNMYDTQKYISSENEDVWSQEFYYDNANSLADLESQIFNEE